LNFYLFSWWIPPDHINTVRPSHLPENGGMMLPARTETEGIREKMLLLASLASATRQC
jgi:hypothetical protein